jgi:hypothetical protein
MTSSVSSIFTVYTVVCPPHVLFHCCRFLLSPVLYRPLITHLLKCFGCGLNGCGWICISNINFQYILCMYHLPLRSISPWGDHATHDWTIRPVKIRPVHCLETLGASHSVVRCYISEELETSSTPMRMYKHSQEAALKNTFELTFIPLKCLIDMIPTRVITFTLYRYCIQS